MLLPVRVREPLPALVSPPEPVRVPVKADVRLLVALPTVRVLAPSDTVPLPAPLSAPTVWVAPTPKVAPAPVTVTLAREPRAVALLELRVPPETVTAVPLVKLVAAEPRVSVPEPVLVRERGVPVSSRAPRVRTVAAAVPLTTLKVGLPVRVVVPKVRPAVPLVTVVS